MIYYCNTEDKPEIGESRYVIPGEFSILDADTGEEINHVTLADTDAGVIVRLDTNEEGQHYLDESGRAAARIRERRRFTVKRRT